MHLSFSPLEFVIRAAVIFLFVLILLRIAGKRQLAQMSATEFVAVLLISNAVENSMNGGDNSLLGGLILATVLIALSWLISLATFKSRRMQSIFEGVPILLIRHGQVIQEHMNHERVSHEELKALLRKQGVHDLKNVDTGILEADGTLTITLVKGVSATKAQS